MISRHVGAAAAVLLISTVAAVDPIVAKVCYIISITYTTHPFQSDY